jgi:hypothetical protein
VIIGYGTREFKIRQGTNVIKTLIINHSEHLHPFTKNNFYIYFRFIHHFPSNAQMPIIEGE